MPKESEAICFLLRSDMFFESEVQFFMEANFFFSIFYTLFVDFLAILHEKKEKK